MNAIIDRIVYALDNLPASCFALFAFLVSCCCRCSVALLYGAVVWSAVITLSYVFI